jgi:subtilisin family serine protease
MRWCTALLAVIALGLAGCADEMPLPNEPTLSPNTISAAVAGQFGQTGRYIVLGMNGSLPTDLARQIKHAGGTLVSTMPEIGVAVAVPAGDATAFRAAAAGIRGVESVTPDMLIPWIDPPETRAEALEASGGPVGGEGYVEDNATFGFLQWAPQSIQAPEAWAEGYTGAGVRVAILDGAVWDQHQDLAPNLDVAASASFVPGFAYNEDTGTFWHGTHVAGIVAASGIGTFGIAPDATLIGVKVLHSGSGAFEWVLNGILYAATRESEGGAGADIINMSLGATLWSNHSDAWKDKAYRDDFRELTKAHDRAVQYASQQGTLVIASAGNGATNFDAVKEFYKIPAETMGVVAVSATGPIGWVYSGATDFYRPAYYTDYGKSLVHVGAPGGTVGLYVVEGVDALCDKGGILNFCEVFDAVLSTTRGAGGSTSSYGWAQGTSMAAPAAAGVAALILQANGGAMTPQALATALERSATDLGKPGMDIWYGHGWVNAYQGIMR